MSKQKTINLEGLLEATYKGMYTSVSKMKSILDNSDIYDEGYIMDIQKEVPFLMHTIQNCILYKDLMSQSVENKGV